MFAAFRAQGLLFLFCNSGFRLAGRLSLKAQPVRGLLRASGSSLATFFGFRVEGLGFRDV